MRISLRARLAVGAALAVAAVVAIAGVTLVAGSARDQYDLLDEELERRARLIAGPTSRATAGDPSPILQAALNLLGDMVVVVADGDAVVYDSRGTAAEPWPAVAAGVSSIEADGQDWRAYRVPIGDAGSPILAETPPGLDLVVALPVAPTRDTVTALRRRTVVVGALAVGAAAALGWLVGTLVLRPLGRLRRVAGQVAGTQDLAVRASADGAPPEVATVTDSLNAMLARLETSAAAERAALDTSRSFAANVAHELRSPLTSLRTNLDLLAHPALPEAERAQVLAERAGRLRARSTCWLPSERWREGSWPTTRSGSVWTSRPWLTPRSRTPGGATRTSTSTSVGARSRPRCEGGPRGCECSSTTCSRTRRPTVRRVPRRRW